VSVKLFENKSKTMTDLITTELPDGWRVADSIMEQSRIVAMEDVNELSIVNPGHFIARTFGF